ncbi:CBS domain-containing protein CBSX5-like [Mangifera indica]|uniref:CBS domain-containing protein CBSX5-like n=1 Tax=Mangifera indica TaxID=29780 RepID=UPI001CFC124D|nr:CBS domain-containing protein CBSX5-like [Mangifera indica]
MAVTLLAHVVSDLCLGKPALRALSVTASIADALFVLKNSEDSFISVWDCDHSKVHESGATSFCRCVGKICMVDVICYLCKEENLLSPSDALKASVSVLLPRIPGLVMHVEPSCSLLEAIDLILEGAQNLIVPIKNRLSTRRKQLQKLSPSSPTSHNSREFCWLTQEDIIRFILSSIGLFSPISTRSIDDLGIISSNIIAVDYDSPATMALEAISQSLIDQTSVAVVDTDGILIGEISPLTLACCDETTAAAIITLSSGDLMAYIDCGGPPEDLVRVVKDRLKEKGLEGMLQQFNVDSNLLPYLTASSSSDEESMTKVARSGKFSRSMSYSARMVRRAEAIVCHTKSSLVAVMIQAVAHRVNYVWVIEEDCSLVGIVTFNDMLKVFRERLESMA